LYSIQKDGLGTALRSSGQVTRTSQKDLARQVNIRRESNVWTVSVGISPEIHITKSDFQNIFHCADNYSK
jgi:hypothetical protein